MPPWAPRFAYFCMPTGRVKFFNPAKGFGFLCNDAGGADVSATQEIASTH